MEAQAGIKQIKRSRCVEMHLISSAIPPEQTKGAAEQLMPCRPSYMIVVRCTTAGISFAGLLLPCAPPCLLPAAAGAGLRAAGAAKAPAALVLVGTLTCRCRGLRLKGKGDMCAGRFC